MTTTYEVSIPNPEDPHDKPIYEGKADEVHGKLTPGDYRATTMGAGVPVTVWVTETASGIKWACGGPDDNHDVELPWHVRECDMCGAIRPDSATG